MVRLLRMVGPVLIALAMLLALLWAGQRSLMYLPTGTVRSPDDAGVPAAEAFSVRTSDGVSLGAWFLRSEGNTTPATVLVFNGNAGNRSDRATLGRRLAEAGFHVCLFDYRGYGGNPGSPSERGLLRDARAVHAAIAGRQDVDPGRIILMGESLGTGVAVALGAEVGPLAVVLRSPFTSMADVGAHHYWYLPVRRLRLGPIRFSLPHQHVDVPGRRRRRRWGPRRAVRAESTAVRRRPGSEAVHHGERRRSQRLRPECGRPGRRGGSVGGRHGARSSRALTRRVPTARPAHGGGFAVSCAIDRGRRRLAEAALPARDRTGLGTRRTVVLNPIDRPLRPDVVRRVGAHGSCRLARGMRRRHAEHASGGRCDRRPHRPTTRGRAAAAARVRDRVAGGRAGPAQKTFTGDLDGMVARRMIRVGTTFNRTFYFVDKGVQRGVVYEFGKSVRGRAEQEAQDGQCESQRRLRPAATGPPGAGPDGRQGRPGAGAGHREAGTAGPGGLQRLRPAPTSARSS